MAEVARVHRPAAAAAQRSTDDVSLGAFELMQQSAGNLAVANLVEQQRSPRGDHSSPAQERFPLAGSVGLAGDNLPDDVARVRARLGELGYDAGSTADDLVAAILAFQRAVLRESSSVDGTITPDGMTHHALAIGATAGVDRDPADLDALVDGHEHPAVVALRDEVREIETLSGSIRRDRNEEQGAARDALVGRIGHARDLAAGLARTDLPTGEVDDISAWAHRRLNAVSPFSSQGRNIDLLETAANTRTCNLTCLAHALEALGVTTADYAGDWDVLERVRTGRSARSGDHAPEVASGHDQQGGLEGLRLPDFLQLALIGGHVEAGASVSGAVAAAWKDLLSSDNLIPLARRFGVSAYVRSGLGSGDPDIRHRYVEAIGGMLDQGLQLVASNGDHFVRIESVTAEGLTVDDPAQWYKRNTRVPWKDLEDYVKTLMVFG